MGKYQVRIHTTHATHPFEECKTYWAKSYEKASAIVERTIAAIWRSFNVWDEDELSSSEGESYYVDYGDKMRTTLTISEA